MLCVQLSGQQTKGGNERERERLEKMFVLIVSFSGIPILSFQCPKLFCELEKKIVIFFDGSKRTAPMAINLPPSIRSITKNPSRKDDKLNKISNLPFNLKF
jgi:hypothetical protein